jgi:uncharacterized protein YvpB
MTGTWEQVWHRPEGSKQTVKVQSKAPTSLFSMSSRLSVGFGNEKFFLPDPYGFKSANKPT